MLGNIFHRGIQAEKRLALIKDVERSRTNSRIFENRRVKSINVIVEVKTEGHHVRGTGAAWKTGNAHTDRRQGALSEQRDEVAQEDFPQRTREGRNQYPDTSSNCLK